jgi:UDP-N-acetylglucosamine 4,6-dehydratase
MRMTLVERCARKVVQLSRTMKVCIAVTADAIATATMLFAALALRHESILEATTFPPSLYVAAALIPVALFAAMGMYKAIFRFISRGNIFAAAAGMVGSTALLAIYNSTLAPRAPFSTIVFAGCLGLLYIIGSRVLVREWLYFRRGQKQRVLIFGAGDTGAQLIRSLRDSGQFIPVAFIDDDPTLQRRVIGGLTVHSPEKIGELIHDESISSVLLAMPTSSRRKRQLILKSLEIYPVHVRTVPAIGDIVAGHASVADLCEVDPSDLLERDPVPPNEALLAACITNKVVMMSGAGGSIGSELCRQILRLRPKRLLLMEMSEPALYQIDRELQMLCKTTGLSVEIVPLLGNAHHRNRAREIMQAYRVQTVYHAAAYKHVPIVEQNVIEGIHNNVFSSWYLAEAALEAQVETFVLISTDKAVNPTNVMGATKRLAELTLQALQERSTHTRFCMVRFGNVLESSGSVVPLFREQIQRGGPVTVTHRDIIRYFMTIPEASQLVLQAGSMGRGGDVFVLDMGRPLRIEDLARRMIRLMGLTVRDEQNPEGDIEITYTGLRPAEKLFEELLIGGNVTGTEHPMIMRAMEPHLPWSELKEILAEMLEALDTFDCQHARELLMRTVNEYRPDSGLRDLVWLQTQQGEPERASVTHIHAHRGRTPRAAAGTTSVALDRGEATAAMTEQQQLLQ